MIEVSEARWAELRKTRWSHDEAREVMSALAASGMSARAFAALHGLSAQRLYWWRPRLDAESGDIEGKAAELVPVTVEGALRTRQEGSMALVHLAEGMVLEVPILASPEWVAALIRSVREV